ncbi:MAG: twin-arginine translocase subunit TatC [Verrucomicrobiae bacterium]|nr:twin-arginine translocase subunit TatC [Verrucomicrobiae bacterium]
MSETPEENHDLQKTFLEHLADFRKMLVRMALSLAVAMGGALFFVDRILELMIRPLRTVKGLGDPDQFLISTGVTDSLTITFQVAFYAGLVISCPLLLIFLGEFVLPALTRREKFYALPAVVCSILLFVVGSAFAYLILLPVSLGFFFEYAQSLRFRPMWSVTEYISFVTHFVLAFGISFELPVVVLLLNRIGILSSAFLRRTRRYAIVLIVVMAAIITPTPDAVTMLLMAGPLILLFEICIWISWAMEWRDLKKSTRDP